MLFRSYRTVEQIRRFHRLDLALPFCIKCIVSARADHNRQAVCPFHIDRLEQLHGRKQRAADGNATPGDEPEDRRAAKSSFWQSEPGFFRRFETAGKRDPRGGGFDAFPIPAERIASGSDEWLNF